MARVAQTQPPDPGCRRSPGGGGGCLARPPMELERSPEDEATAESAALASSDTGHDRVLGTASESVSAGTPAPSNRELAPANHQQPPADPSPRPSDRSLPPSKVTSPPPDRTRPAAEPTQHAAEATETPENATVDPNISPFRRSHPWAAVPGRPYYYQLAVQQRSASLTSSSFERRLKPGPTGTCRPQTPAAADVRTGRHGWVRRISAGSLQDDQL